MRPWRWNKKIDGIQEVVSLGRIYTLRKNDSLGSFDFKPLFKDKPKSQAELDSIKQEVYNLKFYDGFIFSKDSSATLMAITFDKTKLNTKNRLAMVDTIKMRADALKQSITLSYTIAVYLT